MKIRILTFSKANNYGAVLQCYALCKVLTKLGHQVGLIEFSQPNSIKYKIISLLFGIDYTFDKFRKKYLPKFSFSLIEGNKYKDTYDCCIVGSDQVWNLMLSGKYWSNFFLDFVPDDIIKLSYAASFGDNVWRYNDKSTLIKGYLSRFNAISVREDSALDICDKYFQINVEKVIDPVLLWQDYSALLCDRYQFESNQLLGYKFYVSNDWYNLIGYVSKKTQTIPLLLDPISSTNIFKKSPYKSDKIADVTKWLSAIYYSKFIITDSFHCMVFSIIFRKPFIALVSNPNRQDRMLSILKSLGLEGRFFITLNDVFDCNTWMEEIDYDLVENKLSILQEVSIDYLKNNLS